MLRGGVRLKTSGIFRGKHGIIRSLVNNYWKDRYLLLSFIPALIYYSVFHYGPLYGIQVAFKDYRFLEGISRSRWAGFDNFIDLFRLGSFFEVFANTIIISLYKLLWGFPAPIILAILLNEVRFSAVKKTIQTISYLPHFVSWVVPGGLFIQFISPSAGPINIIIKQHGFQPKYFMADPKWFRTVLVATSKGTKIFSG